MGATTEVQVHEQNISYQVQTFVAGRVTRWYEMNENDEETSPSDTRRTSTGQKNQERDERLLLQLVTLKVTV